MATTPIVDRHGPASPEPHRAADDDVRIPGVAALLALGWGLIYLSATSLRPPAHAPSFWTSVPEALFWAAACIAGLGAIRVWRPGAVSGVVAMAAVVACPVIGHHAVGGWFPVQLAGAGALVLANLVAAEGARRRYAVAVVGDSTASK